MKHSSPGTFDDAEPFTGSPVAGQPCEQVQGQNAAIHATDGSDVLNPLVPLELSSISDVAATPPSHYIVLDGDAPGTFESALAARAGQSKGKGIRRRDGKLDKRHKRTTKWIMVGDRRRLISAFWHAKRLRKDLNTNINFHPAYMTTYPEGDLGDWFRRELRNRLARWFSTRGGWFCLWVREAFETKRSEHIHLMVHCRSKADETKLLAMIQKWYPGMPQMVTVTPVTWRRHPITGTTYCAGLSYRLKQMSSRAAGPLRPGRPHRQVSNPKTGSPVAPVFGEKCGTSKNLSSQEIAAWRAERTIRIRARQRIQGERALIERREQAPVEASPS